MIGPKAYLARLGRYLFGTAVNNQSVYRREVPKDLIVLDSEEGKRIFKEAMVEGHCESFFTWVQQFITQSQPSTCGSASMAMILNALKVDPGVNWKGIWRWYDDANIKHMHHSKLKEGLTLAQFHELAKLNSVHSLAFSPLLGCGEEQADIKKSSYSLFKNSVKMCTKFNSILLTVNFNRKALGQTGFGHFSPVAAYNCSRNMALILDVAKFKYDSYWCSLSTLYQSLKSLDSVTNQSRGYLLNGRCLQFDGGERRDEKNEDFLREKSKKWQQNRGTIIESAISSLNHEERHAEMMNFLYLQATEENIYRILNQDAQNIGIQQQQIQYVKSNLNEEALVLLSAFMKNEVEELIRLILLMEI